MFGLVYVAAGIEPQSVTDSDGEIVTFETGRDAATACANFPPFAPFTKTQPRKLDAAELGDLNWKDREQAKLDSGEYTAPVWADLPWYKESPHYGEHFCHVSTADSRFVAYTATAAKGRADVQTRKTPGDYLRAFYADSLESWQIESWEIEHKNQHVKSEVKFATTQQEIERVYVTGPHSCMAHSASRYNSSIHPTRVYAAGDLAVAYIEDEDDSIVSRALCWPARKQFGRAYDESGVLRKALRDLDYSSGSLSGARLLKIEEDCGVVLPYLDNNLCVYDEGNHLILTSSDGDFGGGSTNGIGERMNHYCCSHCGDSTPEDELHSIYDQGEFCESCVEENCALAEDGEYYFDSPRYVVRMSNGEIWSRHDFNQSGFVCDDCHENFPDSENANLESGNYCESCGGDHQPEDQDNRVETYRCDSTLELPLVTSEMRVNFRGFVCTPEEDQLCISAGSCSCAYGTCNAIANAREQAANTTPGLTWTPSNANVENV